MLCLGRKVGESIEIDGGITVTILSISGKQCRVGIAAPPEVHIVRTEIKNTPLPVRR